MSGDEIHSFSEAMLRQLDKHQFLPNDHLNIYISLLTVTYMLQEIDGNKRS